MPLLNLQHLHFESARGRYATTKSEHTSVWKLQLLEEFKDIHEIMEFLFALCILSLLCGVLSFT